MSDLKLRGFAVRAEERMPLPDFAELERRGRALRRRRLAAATGAAVACVLAVAGVVVLRDDSPKAVEPVRPPDDAPGAGHGVPGPGDGGSRPRQVRAGPVLGSRLPPRPDQPAQRLERVGGPQPLRRPGLPRQQRGGHSGSRSGTSASWS